MILTALLDHLWQSTLLALLVWLAVLALGKAPAAARHALWLAASVKFLIPFAALAALGRLVGPHLHRATAGVLPDAALIEKAALPLARFPLEPAPLLAQAPFPVETAPAALASHGAGLHVIPLILLAIWALGFTAVLVRWIGRWASVRAAVRSAKPLDWPAPMPVLASPTLMEPGLVGFLRPVLVAPESLAAHLTRSQIDAILAHEICHLRRKDNLTAAMHTLVEALFWFHPLVWWIGTRLIAERESACDEAVIGAGHDRTTYARSLVESARVYLKSPLSCVAGAAGANLKDRVEAILAAPLSAPLSPLKKGLLGAAGACACATPVMAGLLTPGPQPSAATPVAKAVATIFAPAKSLAEAGPLPDRKPVPTAAPAPVQSAEAPPEPEAAKPIVLAAAPSVLPPGPEIAGARSSQETLSQAAPNAPVLETASTSQPPVDWRAVASLSGAYYTGDGGRRVFNPPSVGNLPDADRPLASKITNCLNANAHRLSRDSGGDPQLLAGKVIGLCQDEIRRLVVAITETRDPAVIDNNVKAVSQALAPRTQQMVQTYALFKPAPWTGGHPGDNYTNNPWTASPQGYTSELTYR